MARNTDDWPPEGGNDVGILLCEGGPTVVAAYGNQNWGDFRWLKETGDRITQDLVEAWR